MSNDGVTVNITQLTTVISLRCMHARSGQKRKRAEDQAAAAVGMKKPNTTPPPEGSGAPFDSANQPGEPMEHDGHDGQPLRPYERASQSELRLDSLSGPPQVLLVVAVHPCLQSAHTYLTTTKREREKTVPRAEVPLQNCCKDVSQVCA